MATTTLEIITPRDLYFRGEVESLTVTTVDGSEGYLPGHVWCNKLLKEDGIATFTETGASSPKRIRLKGGYVEIRDIFTVFTEAVEEE
jgi:F0F1-type ATP synthase epsilon subunit